MITQEQLPRSKRDRIERLRTRLAKVRTNPMDLVDIIKGVLDLLEDEL